MLRQLSTACTIVFAGLTVVAAGAAAQPWRDNNPPGPLGGPGTNWENPRGPIGGPGASPDRLWRHAFQGGVAWVWHPLSRCWLLDRDQNPPGLRGGLGTNWENPPGPIGGPGASPDLRACR